jgi:hypothetical protein
VDSQIKAVLLVPAKDDSHGLLREGPCGARPPVMYRHESGIWEEPILFSGQCFAIGLVLAWDGKPVLEGLDRLVRVGKDRQIPAPYSAPVTVEWVKCMALAWGGVGSEWGRAVFLDADGQEVSCG